LAGKDLGITQKELTQFTESLNQAIILSGASAVEAQAGLIQFSQGIASGALRGDELRSVLEQLPVVADILAKELNVTRGELRELGAQGAITSDIILKAFANARVELSERFARTVPTISQSFQVLRNAVVKTFGEFDKPLADLAHYLKRSLFWPTMSSRSPE
jgi:tape measure domain-containing protein